MDGDETTESSEVTGAQLDNDGNAFVIAIGTVYLFGLWMKESANRYSFQAAMNASRPVVTRPGAISGSNTL